MNATKQETADIHDLACELNRLCPSQVDRTPGDEAGHIGHDPDSDDPDTATVGWFCGGGNAGNAVLRIRPDRITEAVACCRTLPDGAWDNGGLREGLAPFVAEWCF